MIKLVKKHSLGENILYGEAQELPETPSLNFSSPTTAPKLRVYDESYLRKEFGNPANSSWELLKNNMEYIWGYLTKKGLSEQLVAGIMGNMALESNFDYSKRGKNYSGIVQMSNNLIWPAVSKIYGTSLDSQLNYIADYAVGNLDDRVKKDHLGYRYAANIGYMSGKYKKALHDTAENSATHWGTYFERAITNGALQEEAKRRAYAKAIYNYFVNRGKKYKSGGNIKWFF